MADGDPAEDDPVRRRRRRRWALAAGVVAVVVGASLVPLDWLSTGLGRGPGLQVGWLDAVAHVVGAGAIGASTAAALEREGRRPALVIAAGALAAAGLTGALELVQPLVGRDASLADAVANALGAGIGASVAVTVARVGETARSGGKPDEDPHREEEE